MASVFALVGPALAADPFASNFGVYPPAGFNPPPSRDLLLMFAVGNAQLTTQGFTLLPRRTPVH